MFSTPVIVPVSGFKITHESKILCLGSCFAENIGNKLIDRYFDALVNPFGVLFNPASIADALNLLADCKLLDESSLFFHQSLWNSFSFSNLFSGVNKAQTLLKMNESIADASVFFQQTDVLVLTWGTSWIYTHKETGKIVANCHKVQAADFIRKRLTVEEIVETYKVLFRGLLTINPALKVVLTVSPVRHWKDGPHENNLSKSVLLLAADELAGEFDFISYFPSWEIQMDELRDYRFYDKDMLHPSPEAVDYIWMKFVQTYADQLTGNLIDRVEHYNQMLNHRFIHPDAENAVKFKEKISAERDNLITAFPFLKRRI